MIEARQNQEHSVRMRVHRHPKLRLAKEFLQGNRIAIAVQASNLLSLRLRQMLHTVEDVGLADFLGSSLNHNYWSLYEDDVTRREGPRRKCAPSFSWEWAQREGQVWAHVNFEIC